MVRKYSEVYYEVKFLLDSMIHKFFANPLEYSKLQILIQLFASMS